MTDDGSTIKLRLVHHLELYTLLCEDSDTMNNLVSRFIVRSFKMKTNKPPEKRFIQYTKRLERFRELFVEECRREESVFCF